MTELENVDNVQTEHTCECGNHKTWLTVNGLMSDPCPSCGARYRAVKSKRGYKIKITKKRNMLMFLSKLW